MSKKPFVSIVIANYNREYILLESITAALQQNYPKESFEVVLIDNNSSDGTVKKVHEHFAKQVNEKKLIIVPLKYNSGSSGSYVEALKFVNKSWKFLLKMDEDVILDKNCLNEMIFTACKSEKVGMVGGKVYYYKERTKFHAIGSFLSPFFAIAKGIGVNKIDQGQFDQLKKLQGLNGCCILISKNIYNKIGWFDTDYFLYFDDHDLMYKSLKAGFEHHFNPKAISYHDTVTGSKIKYANKMWLYYSTRGSILFLFKNLSYLSLNFYIYLISHNIKFFLGIFYLFYYSKNKKIFDNLNIYFKGYRHGLKKIGGFCDLDEKKINIIIFSGGRGSSLLTTGLRCLFDNKNKKLNLLQIINAYDDGKSTGLIRKFYNDTILGPSDLRKVQENQYNYYYNNAAVKKFFQIRLKNPKKKIIEELNSISKRKYIDSELSALILKLPDNFKKLVFESIDHILSKNLESLDFEDFAFSNLVYASLADLKGGLEHAEISIREVLNLPSPVLLNTSENGYIFGITEDGKLLKDENSIVNYSLNSPIYEIFYSKKPLDKKSVNSFNELHSIEEKKYFLYNLSSNYPEASSIVINSIKKADVIIYGTGTQYSSLYPSYFTKNLVEAIVESAAKKIFITNIDHDNETPGFSAVDQVRQAVFYLNQKNKKNFNILDVINVVISNNPLNNNEKYIRPNRTELEQLKFKKIIIENIELFKLNHPTGSHDSEKLANIIWDIYNPLWK